jgi:hypothetical protein
MILQIKFVTSPIVHPQSRTDSGELQKTTLKGLKDLMANKECSKKQISELEMYINIQNLSYHRRRGSMWVIKPCWTCLWPSICTKLIHTEYKWV